jgi:hypothetical protein
MQTHKLPFSVKPHPGAPRPAWPAENRSAGHESLNTIGTLPTTTMHA